MKKTILMVALSLATVCAFAETNSAAGSNSTSGSTADNRGNEQNIMFTSPERTEITSRSVNDQTQHVVYDNAQVIKNTPSVNGPQLTTSNDTCMGSTSGSVNAPGVGVSFGTTWTDEHCKRLKMSRELWNKGMKAASLAMDCMDKDAREALEMTGSRCPQSMTEAERRQAFAPVAAAPAQVQQPVAINAQRPTGTTVTASAGAIVTRQSDGSTFVDLRTGK